MGKIGFIGFGEVNTTVDVIIRKYPAVKKTLKNEDLYPGSVCTTALEDESLGT